MRPQETLTWPSVRRLDSAEGNVSKFVFTNPGAVAESVLYRYPSYADRTVICCSTQSGCPVGCRFCGAGDSFVRNLTEDEIVEQPMTLLDLVRKEWGVHHSDIRALQIMFMSMGEPMLNQKRLIPAIRRLHESYPNAALLVSTSGPDVDYEAFTQLSVEIPKIGLQFSVHESTNEARNALIPFERKLDLEGMAKVGKAWHYRTGRSPFFNYCVHDRNDTQEDADRLEAIFDPSIWEATLSVICERDETLKVAHERQRELTGRFMRKIIAKGYSARMFDPAGQDDIGGGCGQLHYVQQWFRDNPGLTRPSIGALLPVVHAPVVTL